MTLLSVKTKSSFLGFTWAILVFLPARIVGVAGVSLGVGLETQLKKVTSLRHKTMAIIMQFHSFLEFVPKIQELPLPGLSEQLTMAPAMRKQLLEKSIINPKNAAVICLFYKGIRGETSFYLIRRSSYPGVHSNQVGFPGGQIDPSDQTPWDAAKRELWEELGISPQQITQIRKITPLYIPPSHFWVDCFLAYSTE